MNKYDLMFDLKVDVGHYDLYIMGQWFCITSWRQIDVWTSNFWLIGQSDMTFDLKINVDLCDLYFMAQWFYISNIIWCMIVIFSDNETVQSKLWPQSKYKSTFALKINICQHDLYFMV